MSERMGDRVRVGVSLSTEGGEPWPVFRLSHMEGMSLATVERYRVLIEDAVNAVRSFTWDDVERCLDMAQEDEAIGRFQPHTPDGWRSPWRDLAARIKATLTNPSTIS